MIMINLSQIERNFMLPHKELDVTPLADYKVLLTFDTCERKIFDVAPYIRDDWFGMLKDVKYFHAIHIAGYTIEWAGGQYIAPHELYDYSIPAQS